MSSVVFLLLVSFLLILLLRRIGGAAADDARSDSHRLFPPNAGSSDEQNAAGAGAGEFLYLGTLVSSRGNSGEVGRAPPPPPPPATNVLPYQKLDSPELHPLPPLVARRHCRSSASASPARRPSESSPLSPSSITASSGFFGRSPSVASTAESPHIGSEPKSRSSVSSSMEEEPNRIARLSASSSGKDSHRPASGSPLLPPRRHGGMKKLSKLSSTTTTKKDRHHCFLLPTEPSRIANLFMELNLTKEEVYKPLMEGSSDILCDRLLEKTLELASTKGGARRKNGFESSPSPLELDVATEDFLEEVSGAPFMLKRVDAMLYIANFNTEADHLKRELETLEAACEALGSCRIFSKLLSSIVKAAIRLKVCRFEGGDPPRNLGGALRELVSDKAADGETSVLHVVLQKLLNCRGLTFSEAEDDDACRTANVGTISRLAHDLRRAKEAAGVDPNELSGYVSDLAAGFHNAREVLTTMNGASGEHGRRRFLQCAEEEIIKIQARELTALSMVRDLVDHLNGGASSEAEADAELSRVFPLIRDVLLAVEQACGGGGGGAHELGVPPGPKVLA